MGSMGLLYLFHVDTDVLINVLLITILVRENSSKSSQKMIETGSIIVNRNGNLKINNPETLSSERIGNTNHKIKTSKTRSNP